MSIFALPFSRIVFAQSAIVNKEPALPKYPVARTRLTGALFSETREKKGHWYAAFGGEFTCILCRTAGFVSTSSQPGSDFLVLGLPG